MKLAPLLLGACLAHAGEPDLRRRIAAQTAASHPGFSQAAKDPRTKVDAVAAPFAHSKIWRFEKFLPTRPLIFFVAVTSDGAIVVLTGAPDHFERLIEREVASADEALALVRLFDDTTRAGDERRLLVRSVDDIPFRPGLRAEPSLLPLIHPPVATRLENGDWKVVELGIDGDLLVERSYIVGRKIRRSVRTIRDDLPLVYAN